VDYNIVIPYDFSAGAQSALKTAVELCDKMSAEIHVLHISDEKLDAVSKKKVATDMQVLQNRISEACRINAKVLEGPIGGTILDYVDKLKNPVIFICRSDQEAKYNYTGPNAHYIMANSKCPVLYLKSELDFKKINTILVPLDLSFENKLKLGYALFLAKFFGNALIRLLCVEYDVDDFGLNRLMFRLNHLITFLEKNGSNAVGEIIRCAEEDGELYSRVAVDYAEKSEAELILLMTNDEKAKPGDGISQEADYMLSHFRNNVLLITPFVRV
jgi:nucleotide-binding universal stress UspA family protein